MQELAGSLGCPARFVGFRSDVDDWLLASDIAVVPSLVEPLGNATLEAMSHGLPVIGSEVGGIPEMIVHEVTGLLVPPRCPGGLAEALSRLIAEPDVRRRLGARGRRRCEETFGINYNVNTILNIYSTDVNSRLSHRRFAGLQALRGR